MFDYLKSSRPEVFYKKVFLKISRKFLKTPFFIEHLCHFSTSCMKGLTQEAVMRLPIIIKNIILSIHF